MSDDLGRPERNTCGDITCPPVEPLPVESDPAVNPEDELDQEPITPPEEDRLSDRPVTPAACEQNRPARQRYLSRRAREALDDWDGADIDVDPVIQHFRKRKIGSSGEDDDIKKQRCGCVDRRSERWRQQY